MTRGGYVKRGCCVALYEQDGRELICADWLKDFLKDWRKNGEKMKIIRLSYREIFTKTDNCAFGDKFPKSHEVA